LSFPYLSAIIFLPAIGSIIIAFLGGNRPRLTKYLAALFTLASFILSLVIFAAFDRSAGASGTFQFEEKALWIPPLGAHYHLGMDGLNLPMVVLTAFLGFIVVLISWKENLRIREHFAWLLLLETSILGVFSSLDLLLFFVFWEIELIPMYFIIAVWGTGRRQYSAIKYVIYTLFGSAFILAGILCLYFTTGSLSMVDSSPGGRALITTAIPAAVIFFFLLIGFAVKLPVVPLHTWLPDAHTDAPTAGSVMLAGALIKMGGYGMIRISVGLFPEVARTYAPLLVILAVITVLYGAALTLRQHDLKRMIAYSSVSHMGYVLLGVFALGEMSLTGAVLQMVSHGLLTGLLFAVAGLTIHNVHERDLRKLGGLARQIPIIAVIFFIAGFGSFGVPATSGFIAEYITFIGSFISQVVDGIQVATIVAIGGIILSAVYILWMLQRAFYGPVQEQYNSVKDANTLERFYMFAFVALIMLIGIYPSFLINIIQLGVSPIVRLLGG
jgi:NADH-quinone oxidoreductase subunit M|tara:strand:+ start:1553 stop:3046 length:1494 start_codon:yes stop_codon:yes gene_type:complete